MQINDNFVAAYEALSGYRPLRWQGRLFDRLARGDIPSSCTLPTGLGKTSIIPIWLIALAYPAPTCNAEAKLPRRLVYIVNRRTVVDQATDIVAQMRERLVMPNDRRWSGHGAVLQSLADALRRLAEAGNPDLPLAVSTLRGELADNGEWKLNPARPAIIIGTIDMIGSKLLFSGYGDGRYGRAHHAGLLGQDALVVHDEAHLSPAFDALLRSVAAEQVQCGESRPIRVMSLSATTRGGGAASNGGTDGGSPFGIEDEDRQDPVVSQRLGASKTLTIVDADKDKVAAKIAEEARRLGTSPARVLVYVRSPDDVAKIAAAIEKGLGDGGGTRVARLTGTIRGKERDELAESEVFRAFKSGADRPSPLPHSLYLVSTSAGEVGADWDADHLVCDLTTLDSMIQRFGRVNRLGGTDQEGKPREAKVVVVQEEISDNDPLAAQRRITAEVLRALPAKIGSRVSVSEYDASPAALSALLAKPKARAAFSPLPTILRATDILFDHWSLTSITGEMPGRPEVGPYLHGVAEWEPPETHVAWRADIALLAGAGGTDDDGRPIPCSRDDLAEVFDAFPLRSAETLRDRTDRVQEQLQALAERLREEGNTAGMSQRTVGEAEWEIESETASDDQGENTAIPTAKLPADPLVVLMRGGSAEWVRLSDIAPADKEDAKRAQRRLAFATVVLPVEAGGLKDGMLNGEAPPPKDARSLDVAEAARDGARTRQRLVDGRPLLGGDEIVGVARAMILLTRTGDEDAEPATLEYRVARGQEREPGARVGLTAHNNAVACAAERMGRALGLDDARVAALRLAGKWHDAGKSRALWQRYADNWDANEKRLRDGHPIAKSDRYRHWKMLGGYRHEFGSLLDAAGDSQVRDHPERDLILHLIAAHHGWARPHFEERAFDNEGATDPATRQRRRPTTRENETAAVEVMQRFGRLQQRFGRWGLAWLESLLRCADALASTTREPPTAALSPRCANRTDSGAQREATGETAA